MSLLCDYVGAVRCTDGPQPGMRQAMAWYLGAYRDRGGTNLGIYLCRPIAGTDILSLHAEGRATDFGVPMGASWAQGLADTLMDRSAQLGVQCVIYDRRIWSATHCRDGWRRYNGSDPHTGHLHVEWSWEAARTLTVAHINQVMEGASNVSVEEVVTGLRTPATWRDQDVKAAAEAHGDDITPSLRGIAEWILLATRYADLATKADTNAIRATLAQVAGILTSVSETVVSISNTQQTIIARLEEITAGGGASPEAVARELGTRLLNG